MTRYAIGLGSNVGDRRRHLIEACHQIGERFGRLTISPLYETEPVGGPEQGPFLNAIVVLETDLEPLGVLDVCHEIERLHGRERAERWGPRTLDVDIVATDGPGHADDSLVVPHERASEREFVLRPLIDVWPDALVGEGLTAARALDLIADQGVRRLTDRWVPSPF